MSRLVLKQTDAATNAALVGIAGEVLSVPGVGIAIHDGGTPGGRLLTSQAATAANNLIRNGTFVSAQNGVQWLSIPAAGNIAYIADGWHFHRGGGTTANVAVSRTYAPNEADVPASLRITTVSGGLASSFSVLCQQISDSRLLAGRTVTVTYKAKGAVSRRTALTLRQDFKSATAAVETFVGNSALTTGWQTFTHTFVVPSVPSTYILGTGHFTGLWFWIEAGSDYDARTGGIGNISSSFDIANIRMIVGDSSMPVAEMSQLEETLKVQRYYEKSTATVFMCQSGVNDANTINAVAYLPFRTPKAGSPVITGLTTSFAAGPATSSISDVGFSVLANPNSATSPARITGYVADAEILPY